ncbi:MAG: ribosome silencing factor [Candidatus Margulisiibacteriota bacterium]|jgi:ribosome-associated protein
MNLTTIVKKLAEEIDNQKTENLVLFKFEDITALYEYVLICTANNYIHIKAIENAVIKKVKEKFKNQFDPIRISGTPESGWVIIDLNFMAIHLFEEKFRNFYQLDSLFDKKAVVYHL